MGRTVLSRPARSKRWRFHKGLGAATPPCPFPNPGSRLQAGMRIQRRGAEIAEISAEKSENKAERRSGIQAFGGRHAEAAENAEARSPRCARIGRGEAGRSRANRH